jgi:hypothetical protein
MRSLNPATEAGGRRRITGACLLHRVAEKLKSDCHSERSEESLFDFNACKDSRRDSSLRSE